ncbi:MAG: hypothetical protein ABIC19_00515 [Patescibacteria group bacterium]
MNKSVIIKKLQRFLLKRSTFIEECEVVYFLSEIRKIIEKDKKKYKTLYIYCCWVLHSELSYKNIAVFLSEKFDRFIDFEKEKKNSKRFNKWTKRFF